MAYLGVVQAILGRMRGDDPRGTPVFASHPDNFLAGSAEIAAQLRSDASVNIANVEVPIFYVDPSGHDMESIRPCFTFDILGYTPRNNGESVYDTREYQGDYGYDPVDYAKATVTDYGESDGPLPLMYKTRRIMSPFDILIEIQAMADNDTLSALMVEHVYSNVFDPFSDFLRVPMKDGSYRSWDVLFKDFKDLDQRRAVRAGTPGAERQYSKVWTYTIEGYLDNTDTTQLVNLVKSRKLNMKSKPVVPPTTAVIPNTGG